VPTTLVHVFFVSVVIGDLYNKTNKQSNENAHRFQICFTNTNSAAGTPISTSRVVERRESSSFKS
jgi:hypothetical protein